MARLRRQEHAASRSRTPGGRRRRRLLLVYLLCLLGLLALVGQAWRAWRVERRGIERAHYAHAELQAGVNVDLAQYGTAELDMVLSDLSSIGFRWLRQRFPWSAIQPRPGIYDWERWDALVQAVEERSLRLIAVLDTPPPWAWTGGVPLDGQRVPLPCVPPVDADAYARFVTAFARRYGTVIDHYQVWDEPNLSRAWGGGHVQPCGYAVLLEAAYPGIHAADPTSSVLAGALAPTQAPGPDNLNDLTYLRQLYAAGAKAHFDILAAKAYGFWSGPEDRRVESDVLNFARVVALREWMHVYGDEGKPVWLVEWGWNVLPQGWDGEPAPWGTDLLIVQASRIARAADRARREWPWVEVICWAEYQPNAAVASPRWGFALRGPDGLPTDLYGAVRTTIEPTLSRSGSLTTTWRWPLLLALGLAGAVDAILFGWRIGFLSDLERAWAWWRAWRPVHHLLVLVALGGLYALTPALEWILLELALAVTVLYLHPTWALYGAVFCIPFVYAVKPVGELRISPSETWLALALLVSALRRLLGWDRSAARGGRGLDADSVHMPSPWDNSGRSGTDPLIALDMLWPAWVGAGLLGLFSAPDPVLAAREWRLAILEPALLYALLRWEGQRKDLPNLIGAWMASGVAAALVGLGQWAAGALVAAGNVGRATGPYYSPNHLALYLERVLPVAMVWGIEGRGGRRVAAWGAGALMTAGLYATYSRGAWLLAVPIALVVMALLYRERLRWWAVAVAGASVSAAMVGILQGRLTPLSALASEVRIPVWRSAIEMIADHPWLGVGLDGFQTIYPRYIRPEAWTEPLLHHPHNIWLDAAVRLGLPGLLLLIALMACCLSGAMAGSIGAQRRRRTHFLEPVDVLRIVVSAASTVSLSAGLAHGLVDSGYFLVDLAWSLALVAGLVASKAEISGVANDVEK